jgi:aminopeptidase N
VPGNRCPSWVYMNAGATGYFRAAYPPSMLAALAPDLPTRFTEPERLSLVGDEWAIVRAGIHGIGDYMTLLLGLGREQSAAIVAEVSARLSFTHGYLTTEQSRPGLEGLVQSIFAPLYQDLGLDAAPGDADTRRELRATVIETLGATGNDSGITRAARAKLDDALAGNTTLDASAANAIVRIAARRGDAALWDRLLAAARAATAPTEHYRYLYALASFEDPALIDRSLQFALTDELRSQDTPSFFSRLLANDAARPRVWAFIKRQWRVIAPKVTGSFGETRIVEGLGAFCDNAARDDVRAFFTTNRLPSANRALNQTLERIATCASMRERQSPALTAWLASR